MCVFVHPATSKSAAANKSFISTFLFMRELPFYLSLKNSQIDMSDQFYTIDRF
ncbi:hypothetical protein HK639_26 [Escherichia phage HK639]|uniref:hypothetical protein n=1 Tax=Escherichia phage HK639 TaxID=906669 RepID=UPI00022FB470|nr:hypothetical protein HK639_26 [Escherichia phage HK639]ADO67710.1 unknown [Escherichia phage HK639]